MSVNGTNSYAAAITGVLPHWRSRWSTLILLIALNLGLGLTSTNANAEQPFRPFLAVGAGVPLFGWSINSDIVTYDLTQRLVFRVPWTIGADIDSDFSVFLRVSLEIVPGAPGEDISGVSWETGVRYFPWDQGVFVGMGLVPQRFSLGVSGALGYRLDLSALRLVSEIHVLSSLSFVPAWTTALSTSIAVEVPF